MVLWFLILQVDQYNDLWKYDLTSTDIWMYQSTFASSESISSFDLNESATSENTSNASASESAVVIDNDNISEYTIVDGMQWFSINF